ncbi:MAG TPA: protein kinase [Actinomycetota bacterium]|nr:protein kinase [Actinomycetota bacterium]
MERQDLAGRRLADRYELEEPLADGGMARVWRARDLVLGRPVAVKVLRPELAGDVQLLERFRMEAVAAARLSHPAVVRVFDTGVDDGVVYIVMELFAGPTLREVLRRAGPLTPAEAVRVLTAALQGLAHAHREGVVHRDVKPANILVGDAGVVKVTDFGIAKAAFADGELTTTGDLLGTAKYLAPEQVLGEPVDGRTDLYAAGVVLYEALTGRPPFEADNHVATATLRLTADPTPPGRLRPGIPRDLERAVMRALARQPEARFQSAEEMHAALLRAVSEPARRPRRPRAARAPAERPPSAFRSWVFVPLVAVLVAGLALAGYLVWDALRDGAGSRGADPDAPSFRRVPVAAAFDHDPLGDGEEHREEVPLAFDGDPDTGWETSTYDSAELGGLKDGVGIVFDLGNPEEIGRVRVLTAYPGWRFEIRASDDGRSFAGPLASTDGARSFEARPRTTLDLEPARSRYFLIWMTELAETDGGYGGHVAEALFFSGG